MYAKIDDAAVRCGVARAVRDWIETVMREMREPPRRNIAGCGKWYISRFTRVDGKWRWLVYNLVHCVCGLAFAYMIHSRLTRRYVIEHRWIILLRAGRYIHTIYAVNAHSHVYTYTAVAPLFCVCVKIFAAILPRHALSAVKGIAENCTIFYSPIHAQSPLYYYSKGHQIYLFFLI